MHPQAMRHAIERGGLTVTNDDIDALTRLIQVKEGLSWADHYFDPDRKTQEQIVLFGEEPAGFYTRPRNLVINWKAVMGGTLPTAVFAGASAAQAPWLAPFAVLLVAWDLRSKMATPIKPSHAIVVRAIWECGAHATADSIAETISKNGWRVGQKANLDVEQTITELCALGLVELKEGRARLLDTLVIQQQ